MTEQQVGDAERLAMAFADGHQWSPEKRKVLAEVCRIGRPPPVQESPVAASPTTPPTPLTANPPEPAPQKPSTAEQPLGFGSGFFITNDGFAVTNAHVVKLGSCFKIIVGAGTERERVVPARVVKVDEANDLALLQTDMVASPVAIAPSREVRLGSTVFSIGFPDPQLQGQAHRNLPEARLDHLPGFRTARAVSKSASLCSLAISAERCWMNVPMSLGLCARNWIRELPSRLPVCCRRMSIMPSRAAISLSFLEAVPGVMAKLKQPNVKRTETDGGVRCGRRSSGAGGCLLRRASNHAARPRHLPRGSRIRGQP